MSFYYSAHVIIAIVYSLSVLENGLRKTAIHLTFFKCCSRFVVFLKVFFWILPSMLLEIFYPTFLIFNGMGLFCDSYDSIISKSEYGN